MSKKTLNPTRHCKSLILEGTVLVIDPSTGATGDAGWAEFKDSVLMSWGIIQLPKHKNPYYRFKAIAEILLESFDGEYDALVLELLKGRYAKLSLKQSCAVFAACTKWQDIVMITPKMWQAVADRLGGHIKRDDIDAVYMGYTAVAFAEGYDSSWKREAQIEFLNTLIEEHGWSTGPWD